jgi:translation initiation factor 5A
MECPIVKRTELQLIDMDEEGFVTLMDDAGETRDDLQVTDLEVKKEIQGKIDAEEDALVCVLSVSTRQIQLNFACLFCPPVF